jgi:hypothetical protein
VVNYELNQTSPPLELRRLALMQSLRAETQTALDKLRLDIDASNVLPRWIMLQYSSGTYFVDPVFPQEAGCDAQLEKDIATLALRGRRRDAKPGFAAAAVRALDLRARCAERTQQLRDFVADDSYAVALRDTRVTVARADGYFVFAVADETFRLHATVMQKLMHLYSISGGNSVAGFKTSVACVLLRYHTLDSQNQQLAVNPDFYACLRDKHGVNFELFGSPLNCFFDNYCSLFWDIERSFNSKGGFNNIELRRGVYVANPPYDEEIMRIMALKLVAALARSPQKEDGTTSVSKSKAGASAADPLSFVVIVPVWDDPKYGVNESCALLSDPRFCVFREKIEKHRAKFFNYSTNKFVYPCDIYIMLLQNAAGRRAHPIPLDRLVARFY